MANNVTVAKDGTTVTIFTISVKENHINVLESFDILKTPSKRNEGEEKKLLDFLGRTRNIEVTGFIAKEIDGSTPTTTLRTRLISMFNAGGNVVLTYLGESISGAMTQLEFREVPADASASVPTFFRVTFSIVVGSEI